MKKSPYQSRPVLALCLAVKKGITCERACQIAGLKCVRDSKKK